jgi:hypothetical protein
MLGWKTTARNGPALSVDHLRFIGLVNNHCGLSLSRR